MLRCEVERGLCVISGQKRITLVSQLLAKLTGVVIANELQLLAHIDDLYLISQFEINQHQSAAS